MQSAFLGYRSRNEIPKAKTPLTDSESKSSMDQNTVRKDSVSMYSKESTSSFLAHMDTSNFDESCHYIGEYNESKQRHGTGM